MKIRIHALLLSAIAAPVQAGEVYSSTLNFASNEQSLWDSGTAFSFDYQHFFGQAVNPSPYSVNPSRVSGGSGLGAWTVDPYFQFYTNFKAGIDVGANVNGGSIQSKLDYAVAFSAPNVIVKGSAFSLAATSSRLPGSGFVTRAPSASAYVDGIVEAYLGSYFRFVTTGAMGDHDYRLGRKGFTDGDTSNTAFSTTLSTKLSPEIVSFNRNDNGRLKVVGVDQGGVGSQYSAGATTITAGDWRVAPAGTLAGSTLKGSDKTTLLTATLDVDQLVTGGAPVLGTGVTHDWGVIAVDMGYDVLDFKASLAMGLQQDLSLQSSLRVTLDFSNDVMVAGVATRSVTGAVDALPDITLLSDAVTVTPRFLVDAQLSNATKLTFDGGLDLTILAAHANATYDFRYFFTDYKGNIVKSQNYGPFYRWSDGIALFDIGVYDNTFALGGFQTLLGDSFVLSAVPEPAGYGYWLAGLGLLALRRPRGYATTLGQPQRRARRHAPALGECM